VALYHPRDQHHQAATEASERLQDAIIVTSEAVLVEFLNFAAQWPDAFRQGAVKAVRQILDDPNVETEHLTHRRFSEALDLYEDRPDKGYSLTDCISMCVIRDKGIHDVLTRDHHFEQEGYTILIR
jgi:predicted nucleic acid-binding protein